MIYGHKVGLRLLEEEDLPLLTRWRNDPRSRDAVFSPLLLPLAAQRKWFERLLGDPTRIQFLIIRLEDKAPVGTIGLEHINYRNQDCSIGLFIQDPDEREVELAVNAAETAIRYAFQALNLHRVESKVFAFNHDAAQLNERIGFQQEGIERKSVFVHGEFQDVLVYSILREEWQNDAPGAMTAGRG